MKNLKVYSALFVSVLLFSQSVFAQNLKIQNDRSLKSEKRIEAKTNATIQNQSKTLELEKRNTESSVKQSASSEITPTIDNGATISNATIINNKVSASEKTIDVSPTSKTPLMKNETTGSTSLIKVKSVGQPNALKAKESVSYDKQKTTAQPTNVSMGQSTADKADLFHGDSKIKSELKSTDVALYKEYLKERQTIASVLNRVTANAFKNGAERSKYTQLLNSYKQKYNF